MSKAIKDCWCIYCGHPVMVEGVTCDAEDDYDRAGHGRDRCAESACVSSAVATVQGGVLVVCDEASS